MPTVIETRIRPRARAKNDARRRRGTMSDPLPACMWHTGPAPEPRGANDGVRYGIAAHDRLIVTRLCKPLHSIALDCTKLVRRHVRVRAQAVTARVVAS